MSIDPQLKIQSVIGARLRKARKEKCLTQEQLAAPRFSKGYVSALERGSVRPSIKALEHFAARLELPVSHFLLGVEMSAYSNVEGGLLREPDIDALQEDLNYQYNYARMVIRAGTRDSIERAFQLIKAAEESASMYAARLDASVLYRPHFLRGLSYLQISEPDRALPEFERSLEIALADEQSSITVRNMLGVAYYLLQQPSLALHQHAQCLNAIEIGTVKDLSLKLSILHNLANDYWALNDVTRAIVTYKRALPLVEDISGPARQASLYWALALAYKAANDWAHAKLYATRALHIYETLDDIAGASSVLIHLAELLAQDARYDEAEQHLERAGEMIATTGNQVLLCTVHSDYANISRKKGQLDVAVQHVEKSLAIIEELAEKLSDNAEAGELRVMPESYTPLHVTRAYVEALHTAALIAEERGDFAGSDELFQRTQQLVSSTGLVELAHTIAFAYADALRERGEFEKAAAQYRIAAQSIAKPPRSAS